MLMSSVTKRMWEVFALTDKRRIDSKTGDIHSQRAQVPIRFQEPQNISRAKDWWATQSLAGGAGNGFAKKKAEILWDRTEAQRKKSFSSDHDVQIPSTGARYPVQFFLRSIAMLGIGNCYFIFSPLSFQHETSLEFLTVTGTISVCLSPRSCLSNKSSGNVTGCTHAIRSATRFCWMCMVMIWHFEEVTTIFKL